jgi:serine/threonine protein kinase
MPEERDASHDCPPDMAFVELVEGRLLEPDASGLRRHAEHCARCHAALLGLEGEAPAGLAPTIRATGETGDGIARELLREGDADPSIGKTIDWKYRLLRRLGAGGMGSVYEAEHTGTGRRVAVKRIHAHLLMRGDDIEDRFRREARVVGAIDSPHVVEILDAGEDEDTGDLYLVMEHLRGEDLQRLIDRVGPLPPEVALRVAAQALAGLVKAHAASVVHRDIKPANLFLARGDGGEVTVKLLDFGVAKITADAPSVTAADGLATTKGLLGSPLYMSPEQVQSSGEVDLRTDLWSLGSVLYCALAGRAPFAHFGTYGRVMVAICSSAPRPLRALAPWVPPETAAVVARALAADREARYPSAAAMLDAVRALLPGGVALRDEMLAGVTPEARAAVVASQPPPKGEPSPPRWRRPAGIAAGVALAAAVSIALWPGKAHERGPAPQPPAPGAGLVTAPDPSSPAVPASNEPAVLSTPSVLPSASAPGLPRLHQGAPAHTAAPPAPPAQSAKPAADARSHKPGVVEDVPF